VGHADPDGLETIAAWDCHPDCPARRLGEQSGERTSGSRPGHKGKRIIADTTGTTITAEMVNAYGDHGTAARFFYQAAWELEHADPVLYCAKASRSERSSGLDSYLTVKYNIGQEVSALWNEESAALVTSLERVRSSRSVIYWETE